MFYAATYMWTGKEWQLVNPSNWYPSDQLNATEQGIGRAFWLYWQIWSPDSQGWHTQMVQPGGSVAL
jgi:hypothetical protein